AQNARRIAIASEDHDSFAAKHRTSGGTRRLRCQRHREPEIAALADLALDADLAAHQLTEAFAYGQAEAGAAFGACGRALDLGEGAKELLAVLRGDASPGV